jgi:Protein kinase domain
MSAGIVHRDLKLENMVMLNSADDSPVKIADFGLSKFFSADNVLSTMCGSPQVTVRPSALQQGGGTSCTDRGDTDHPPLPKHRLLMFAWEHASALSCHHKPNMPLPLEPLGSGLKETQALCHTTHPHHCCCSHNCSTLHQRS